MDYLIPGVKGSQTQNIFQTFVKMGGLGVILGKVSVNHCAGHSGNQPLDHCCCAESLADLRTAAWLYKIVLIIINLGLGFSSTLHRCLFCTVLCHREITFNFSLQCELTWKRESNLFTIASSCDFIRQYLVFFLSGVILSDNSWNKGIFCSAQLQQKVEKGNLSVLGKSRGTDQWDLKC